MDDYILERTAMPEENVRKAQGDTVFEEERPLVFAFLIHRFLICTNSCIAVVHKVWHEFHVQPSSDFHLAHAMVSVSDSRSRGPRFDSQPVHRQATTLGRLLTPMCLCHQAV